MRFKVGDKVILNLKTKYGSVGCNYDDHNREFIIIDNYSNSDIQIQPLEESWTYGVYAIMLTPVIKPGEQLLFPFMKEE